MPVQQVSRVSEVSSVSVQTEINSALDYQPILEDLRNKMNLEPNDEMSLLLLGAIQNIEDYLYWKSKQDLN